MLVLSTVFLNNYNFQFIYSVTTYSIFVKNDIINVAITIQAFETIRFYKSLRLFILKNMNV